MNDKDLKYYFSTLPEDLQKKCPEFYNEPKAAAGRNSSKERTVARNIIITAGLTLTGVLAAVVCVIFINNKKPGNDPAGDPVIIATDEPSTTEGLTNLPSSLPTQTHSPLLPTDETQTTPTTSSNIIPTPPIDPTLPPKTNTPEPTVFSPSATTPAPTPTAPPTQPYDYPEVPKQDDYIYRKELYWQPGPNDQIPYFFTYREIYINVGDSLEVPVTQGIKTYIAPEANTMSYIVGDESVINFERLDEFRPNGSTYNFNITALKPGDTYVHVYGYYDPTGIDVSHTAATTPCVSIDVSVKIHVVESGGSRIIPDPLIT